MQNIHFIVGTGRCGTNLLNRMFGEHPQLLPITETHFISTLATKFADVSLSLEDFWQILDEHYTSNGKNRWIDTHFQEAQISDKAAFKKQFLQHCNNHSYTTHAQRVMAFLNHCYQKNTPDKKRFIIDKTPQYGLHLQAISRLFPQSKFIHVIRDGRFAAISMTKHKGISRLITAGHPDNIENFSYQAKLSQTAPLQATSQEAILYWQKVLSRIKKQADGLPTSQYLEVQYEDLIMNPRKTLQQIYTFLDLPALASQWQTSLMPNPRALVDAYENIQADDYSTMTDLVKQTLEEHGYFTGHLSELQNNKTEYQPDYWRMKSILRQFLNI